MRRVVGHLTAHDGHVGNHQLGLAQGAQPGDHGTALQHRAQGVADADHVADPEGPHVGEQQPVQEVRDDARGAERDDDAEEDGDALEGGAGRARDVGERDHRPGDDEHDRDDAAGRARPLRVEALDHAGPLSTWPNTPR